MTGQEGHTKVERLEEQRLEHMLNDGMALTIEGALVVEDSAGPLRVQRAPQGPVKQAVLIGQMSRGKSMLKDRLHDEAGGAEGLFKACQSQKGSQSEQTHPQRLKRSSIKLLNDAPG